MTRKLRVTQLVFDLNGGGMETLVANMARRWHRSDVTMSVITISGRIGHVGEFVKPLVEQYLLPKSVPTISMLAPSSIAHAIRVTRPDVVHLHSGCWYKGALAARIAKVPRVIYTEHGREHHDPVIAKWLDLRASRWTNRIAAVSPRLVEYMATIIGIDRVRMSVVPNGVDTDMLVPGEPSERMRTMLGIPQNALVIGSVGRLEPVKAYSRLVEAYARLRTRDYGRPLYLALFGEGTDRANIERTVAQLGVGDGVRMPGWTDKPADAYRALDVFAMTSRSEGMSISLMEAMACGICPLVTDVGSNREVLGSTLNRHIVPDGDTDQLVRYAHMFLSAPEVRAMASESARERAVQAHSLDRTLASYERLYEGGSLGIHNRDKKPVVPFNADSLNRSGAHARFA